MERDYIFDSDREEFQMNYRPNPTINQTRNLIIEIKTLINQTKSSLLKTINSEMVKLYFEIGKRIIENEQGGKLRAEYGKELLKHISQELTEEFGKGFSVSNLKQMRQFYTVYQKRQTLSGEFNLPWSHYCELIKIEDETKRLFYERYAIEEGLSVRDLKRQIQSLFYERLHLSIEKKSLIIHERDKFIPESMEETLKDPYILEFLGLEERYEYNESDLEQAIMDNLQKFLLELGQGFSFMARQKRFTLDNDHFYIDLLFYNIYLKAYVVIELKTTKFKHEYSGQINFYLNYVKDQLNKEDDREPIGIILCTEKCNTQVQYSLIGIDKQIFPTKYKVSLPTQKDLQKLIDQTKKSVE